MSMDDAPDTLGICRLVDVDSFKAEAGTLPRALGMWRPARLAADCTLRQMLLPRRTCAVVGAAPAAAPHPSSPSAAAPVAAVWVPVVALMEAGATLAFMPVGALTEGCRKVGAATVVVCVDWLVVWRVEAVLLRCRFL